jgi:hypothetical protein
MKMQYTEQVEMDATWICLMIKDIKVKFIVIYKGQQHLIREKLYPHFK